MWMCTRRGWGRIGHVPGYRDKVQQRFGVAAECTLQARPQTRALLETQPVRTVLGESHVQPRRAVTPAGDTGRKLPRYQDTFWMPGTCSASLCVSTRVAYASTGVGYSGHRPRHL